MRYVYIVQMPAGDDRWYTICTCASASALGAVMTALADCGCPPAVIRVESLAMPDTSAQ